MQTIYAQCRIRTGEKTFEVGDVVEGVDEVTLKRLAQAGALTHSAPEEEDEDALADVDFEDEDDEGDED